jgi:hypothetical protein
MELSDSVLVHVKWHRMRWERNFQRDDIIKKIHNQSQSEGDDVLEYGMKSRKTPSGKKNLNMEIYFKFSVTVMTF